MKKCLFIILNLFVILTFQGCKKISLLEQFEQVFTNIKINQIIQEKSDYLVLLIETDEFIGYEFVDEVGFCYHSTKNQIIIYSNNTIYTIKEAYELKIITKTDLIIISNSINESSCYNTILVDYIYKTYQQKYQNPLMITKYKIINNYFVGIIGEVSYVHSYIRVDDFLIQYQTSLPYVVFYKDDFISLEQALEYSLFSKFDLVSLDGVILLENLPNYKQMPTDSKRSNEIIVIIDKAFINNTYTKNDFIYANKVTKLSNRLYRVEVNNDVEIALVDNSNLYFVLGTDYSYVNYNTVISIFGLDYSLNSIEEIKLNYLDQEIILDEHQIIFNLVNADYINRQTDISIMYTITITLKNNQKTTYYISPEGLITTPYATALNSIDIRLIQNLLYN